MADKEITILLALEAIDKASSIFEKVAAKIESIGQASQDAAEKANLSGDELAAAQVKAEAAANAAATAERVQAEAQTNLAKTSEVARDALAEQQGAQEKLAAAAKASDEATGQAAEVAKAAYAEMSAAADAAATSAQAAVAKQVAALDMLTKADAESAARAEQSAAAQDVISDTAETSGSKLTALTGVAGLTAAAVAGIGYESVKAAASFQSATTVLVTSGGETAANIAMVRQGILGLASTTGTATQELTNGMYMIGSAGYTGASGLNVLKASAQGAKAENADLGTVSNALTTVLKDYGVTSKQVAANQSLANAAMDQMITVVQNGKTTTEALAGSLSNVLPSAVAAKLGFDQVGGALATMTGEGMSAQQAAQDLNHTIGALSNPNAVAVKEMQSLGVSATDVQKGLGKNGLTGTLETLTSAITSHMGPAGLVIQNAFAASKTAAQDANAEISQMPASLQSLAKSYMSGSVTAKQWKLDLQALDPVSAHLMTQFASTANKTHQFNDLLSAGSPAAQTYQQALSKMMGGTTGLQTALMLTGTNLGTFKTNVAAVGAAGKKAGTDVEGWAEIQATMNQKLAELKETANAAMIQLGTALLPAVTKLLSVVMAIITPIATWIGHNKTLAAVILGVVGALALGILTIVAVAKVVSTVSSSFETLGKVWGHVGDVAGKVGKGLSSAKDFFSGLGDTISTAASTAKDFGSSALEAAQSFGSSLWSGAVDTLSSVGSALESAAVATGQWIASATMAAATAARAALAWTAEKVALIATTVAEKAAAAAQWLLDAAMAISPITLIVLAIVALVGAFILLWNKSAAFRDFWIDAWHLIETMTELEIKAVVAIFEDLYHGASELVGDVVGFVEGHWRLLLSILTGPIGIAVALITKYWSDIKHWFQDGVSAVSSIVAWFGSLPGKFSAWLAGVVSAISQKIGEAITWFESLPTKIKAELADAATWLYDIGRNIVQGLINGVKNMAGQAVDAVKNIGHDLISGAKSVLSIFSPSQEFHAIGTYTIAGFAEGITAAAPSLMEAMTKAATSITGPSLTNSLASGARATGSSLVAATASGLAVPGGAGSGQSGTVINLTVTGNTVMSDSDTDKLVTKIGNRLTGQLLGSGGVRITKVM